MGEANRRAATRSQTWNVRLTCAERFELRSILLQRHTKDDAVMDRNNDAIEALEGDDTFDMPGGLAKDAQQVWLASLQGRLDKQDRVWIALTIENIATILDGVEWCAQNGVITNQQGERVVLMDGARAYRIRHARKRLKAAKSDVPILGEAEPARIEVPAEPA